MNKSEIIERLKKIAEHAVHIAGEAPFDMSLDDGIAVHEAIELLEKPIQPNHNAEPGKMVDDTISRQETMEKLMAQNVIMVGSEYYNGFNAGVNRAQEVIRNLPPANDKLIQIIEEGIKATGTADDYSVGMCNGMKWCKSLLDGKEPKYDIVQPKYKKRRR